MREFDVAMNRAFKRLKLEPGDIYESCSYHPVLCLGVDYKKDEIWGVSLINGHHPMSCSLVHCGIRKLSPKQAWHIKIHGPSEPEERELVPMKNRWWNSNTTKNESRVKLVGPRKAKNTLAKSATSARTTTGCGISP